jgi:2,3-bisphosphoglycerate-dependent phosphoglycerate mutase
VAGIVKRGGYVMKIVLVRHGESEWNKENRFTGWTDVGLSEKGIEEAREAADSLVKGGYTFDVAFTSFLRRAVETLNIILDKMDLMWIPIYKSWRLNERHYGALQGLNKIETVEKFGEAQVKIWRRSYDVMPPALERSDPRNPENEAKYAAVPKNELPLTESLKETCARAIPYWDDEIWPQVKSGSRVLVSAHGNSMRALVKYLENIDNETIVNLNIPTGIPLVYDLDGDMKVVKKFYLADEAKLKAEIEKVESQSKAKK